MSASSGKVQNPDRPIKGIIRAAITGCGRIADQHVQAIRRIPGAEIVGLCDRELLMARQLGERFGVHQCFVEFSEMLRVCQPDVVHITTPPQSHYALGRQALESGCHVYLEKPFTVTSEEAIFLTQLATARDLCITAGHNLQFTLEMLEMRKAVRAGFLGGRPVHLESHFSYSLDDTTYVGAMLGSSNHWVRKLPGQLFHNIISHPVARLAEFLDDEITEIQASAHQSARLRGMNGQEVLDELRVLMRDKHGTTAFLCFSTQIKPGMSRLRICGPKNSILVDQGCGCVYQLSSASDKSYLTFFLPPLRGAKQHLRNFGRNVSNFISGRLHQDSGMKELLEQFYDSIRGNTAPPIPYREIVLTARIMDEIFAQLQPKAPELSRGLLASLS